MRALIRALITLVIAATFISFGVPAPAQEVRGPIRLVPESPDSWVRLHAKFTPRPDLCPARQPRDLHAAYPGILEIGRRDDGRLYLVTELDFPRYLKGIAEVPRDWPIEALKAQVVAARTYAMSHMNPTTALARELGYNLCATDACQVYRGLVVEAGAWGDRWSQAVDETAGQILLHQGRPAETFYFSTSNGRTYSNADIFGGEALPHLQPVTETDDGESPLANWTVQMPLGDLTETLRLAGSWGEGSVERVRMRGDEIVVTGGGQSVTLSVTTFRNNLNAQAVCLEPKRYPTPGVTGRALPQVIPSRWFQLAQRGGEIVVTGRGWGHGVGMVQWGLKGKAEQGMTHQEMLAFYYGGLEPAGAPEPGNIRIGLAVDIDELLVERRGHVAVQGAEMPEGPVRIRGGESIVVEPGEPIPAELTLTNLATSGSATPEAPAEFTFELSGPANLSVRYRGAEDSGETDPQPFDRGPQTLAWEPSGIASGNYEVRLLAADGVDEVESEPVIVEVVTPEPSPEPSPSPSPAVRALGWDGPLGTALRAAGWATLALLIAAGAVMAFRFRRRPGRGDAQR